MKNYVIFLVLITLLGLLPLNALADGQGYHTNPNDTWGRALIFFIVAAILIILIKTFPAFFKALLIIGVIVLAIFDWQLVISLAILWYIVVPTLVLMIVIAVFK